MRTLRVASRRSALAMTQTQWVIDRLRAVHPELHVDIVPIVTRGDKIVDVALSKVGGKGLFVSELEQSLLNGQADFAVHSLKDVPSALAPGLVLGAMAKREDPRDAVVTRDGRGFHDLPRGAKVGTSSLRRIAQLRSVRPDLEYIAIRGNVDTRLRRLEAGDLSAIILAAAGLRRMGWEHRIVEYLSPELCLPAVGQGVLGIENRAEDTEVNALLAAIHDPATACAALAERTLLAELNGGCQVPIAGYAEVRPDGQVWLRGMVADPDGGNILRAEVIHLDPVAAGRTVASELRAMGADQILEATAVTER